jgi:hypothetical protein
MVKVGDRIKLTAPLTNKNSTWMPVEEGMPAGLEGVVVHVNFEGPREWHQISVKWDNGRALGVMPYTDSYEVIQPPSFDFSFYLGRIQNPEHEKKLSELAAWLDTNKFACLFAIKKGDGMFDVSPHDPTGWTPDTFKLYVAEHIVYQLSRLLGETHVKEGE